VDFLGFEAKKLRRKLVVELRNQSHHFPKQTKQFALLVVQAGQSRQDYEIFQLHIGSTQEGCFCGMHQL
jgi:hypothetical protein